MQEGKLSVKCILKIIFKGRLGGESPSIKIKFHLFNLKRMSKFKCHKSCAEH